MFRLRLTRVIQNLPSLTLLVLIIQSYTSTIPVRALSLSVQNPDCADVLLAFTRGSGQNKSISSPSNVYTDNFKDAEPESYAFFNDFKTHLDVEYPHVTYKAVSIHDFPGKYDPVGYKAVGVGLFTDPENLANAEVSMIPGDYRESVDHGVAETVGYLRDQMTTCPNQAIVVGGYSQGAQVMGDALAQLSASERNRILGVSFVGDPKFIAAHGDSLLNPFDHAVSYPWRRGDATDHDQGMLESRIPYVPQDIEKRTVSYCIRVDIVCSGWSGFNKNYRQAHASYAAEPTRNNVNELIQWAAPTLAGIERSRGGLGTSSTTPGSVVGDTKPRDVMFLLNDDSMPNSLYPSRYDTDQVLSGVAERYPNVNYAAKGFGEDDNGTAFIPRVDNIQSFQLYGGYDPNNPVFSTSNLRQSLAIHYPFGNQYPGGGDWPDPDGLAIEKAAFAPGWRPEAEKHIVLVTDRPPKDDYSFNICNSTVRSWLHVPDIDGYKQCFTNGGVTDIWPKIQDSEFCKTIYLAITSDDCKNDISEPGYVEMITRKLNDAIVAAQTQHIAVDVVIPNIITNQYHPELIPKMKNDLEYLAKATGGIFIDYNQRDKFDQATYSDMMYQILGHAPKDIMIAYKEALETRDGFNSGQILKTTTNQPVILDASQSSDHFDTYKWDFDNDGIWDETSAGPVIEHTFSGLQMSFVRMAGVNADGTTAAETHLAVSITENRPSPQQMITSVPNFSTRTNSDGSITLNWESDQIGALIVSDPATSIPLVMANLTDRSITIPSNVSLDYVGVRAISEAGSSDPVLIPVTPMSPGIVVTDDPGPLQQDQSAIPPVQGPKEPAIIKGQDTDTPESIPDNCLDLQQCLSGIQQQPAQPNIEISFVDQVALPELQITTDVVDADSSIGHSSTRVSTEPNPQVKGINTSIPATTLPFQPTNVPYKKSHNWLWIAIALTVLVNISIYLSRRHRRKIATPRQKHYA